MTGTRLSLLRFWFGLLALTAVTVVCAVVALDLGRRDAGVLRAGEAPGVEGVAAARESMLAADAELIVQFAALQCQCAQLDRDIKASRGQERTQHEREKTNLTSEGAGERYEDAFTAASRQIAQVSQAEVGGRALEDVQVLQGLLSTYDRLVGKAFQDDPNGLLAPYYVQLAHHFLEDEVLRQLDVLLVHLTEDSPGPARPIRHLLWAVPLLALLALLGRTQVWVARRFRRTLSVPLLAATALSIALGVTAGLAMGVDGDLSDGRRELGGIVAAYTTRGEAVQGSACADLKKVSEKWAAPPQCSVSPSAAPAPEDPGDCPATARNSSTSDRDLLAMANSVSMTARSATDATVRAVVAVVVLGLLIGSLSTLGLLPRLEEYRFRRR